MRYTPLFLASLFAVALCVVSGTDAAARAGGGGSFGSRGSRSYSSSPSYSAQPFSRTTAARPSQPSYSPSYAAQPQSPGYGGVSRHPFMSGIFGGLVGAGIGHMLFGGGYGGGMGYGGGGGSGLFPFLLLAFVGWWIFKRIRAGAGAGGLGGERPGGQRFRK